MIRPGETPPPVPSPPWSAAWTAVSDVLTHHLDGGRAHLLTEDVVRFAMARALEDVGVAPSRITIEYRGAGIGPIDLVIDAPNLSAAVEIKFPRDPTGTGANDTMTVGELLNDFYRLARLTAVDRWALQILDARLAGHLSRRRDIAWVAEQGREFVLPANLRATMPKSAGEAMKAALPDQRVVATCEAVHRAGPLTVAAYQVEAWVPPNS